MKFLNHGWLCALTLFKLNKKDNNFLRCFNNFFGNFEQVVALMYIDFRN